MAGSAGFSLLEVIVSLALVSLVSISGFTLVDALARAQDRLDKRYAQLEDIQIFLSDFSENLATSDPAQLRLSAGVLELQSRTCGQLALIRYSSTGGKLGGTGSTCPGADLSLANIERAAFEVVDADMTGWSSWPQQQRVPSAVAVRLNITFGPEAGVPGTLTRIVEIPRVVAS